MANDARKPSGPDLAKGIPGTDLAEGAMVAGHVEGDEVLLARQGGVESKPEIFGAVRGTMRISACKRVKPWPHPP